MDGHCQCGLITFRTPLPTPTALFICHCLECRHQSSSAFGVTARFPYFDIPEPTPGSISSYTRPNSNGQTLAKFCTNCGSRLLHIRILPDGTRGDTVSVKGGCLGALTREMMDRAVHIWTKRAVVRVPEGVEAYEEQPTEK